MLNILKCDTFHENKIYIYILKEQHIVKCICVFLILFFHRKEAKATSISSAFNKKLIRLVKIQICSEKKKFCCKRESLSSLIYCSVIKQITNGK